GRIVRIHGGVESIAAVHTEPIVVGNARGVSCGAGPAPASVVLQTAADPVGRAHVQTQFVELSEGHRIHVIPTASRVVAPMDAAVGARDHMVRIGGINPHGVVIAVDAKTAGGDEGLAAVLGMVDGSAEHPDAQVVVGIDADLAVVGGPRVGIAHARPILTFVVAAKDSALGLLDEGTKDVGIAEVDGQADASHVAAVGIGKPFGQFLPSGAAVDGLVNASAGA